MDEGTKERIRQELALSEARIPELEADIEKAKAAGLGALVASQEATLAKTKALIAQIKAVYGGP